MPFAHTTRTLLKLALVAGVVPAMAAMAETKPALLLIHTNIHNTVDEQHWQDLNTSLANDGFRVLSLAATPDQNQANVARLNRLMATEAPEEKVVVISTAATSEVATGFAESHPNRVKAIAYISAEPSIATLGPRTVSVPTDLASRVPSYQIKITGRRRQSDLQERGASTFLVREQGQTTLANLDDLEITIKRIAKSRQTAPATGVQMAQNVAPAAL